MDRKPVCFALLFLTMFASNSSARVWYVKPDGTGEAPNIQAGIDSCASGDTVLAASGKYEGLGNYDIDFKGKAIVVRSEDGAGSTMIFSFGRAFYFHSGEDSTSILEGFRIGPVGGGPGIECDASSPTIKNNSIWGSYGRFIDLSGSSARIYDNDIGCGVGDGIYCVSDSSIIKNNRFQSDDAGRPIVCTNSHNRITGNEFIWGKPITCNGGSYEITDNWIRTTSPDGYAANGIECVSCDAVIRGNTIKANFSGIRIDNGKYTIENNVIHHCRAGTSSSGGGIRCSNVDSSTTIVNNSIIDNHAGDTFGNGGGIYCDHASPLISGNLIAGNVAYYAYGGAIGCNSSSPRIFNNTIVDNKSSSGAIYCINQSNPLIERDIVMNSSYDGSHHLPPAAGICVGDTSSHPTIKCCDVFNNQGGSYAGIPDQTGINGNISVDPVFCDAAAGDYQLHVLSPCLPANHPDGASCGLIGALGRGCGLAAPRGLTAMPIYYDNSVVGLRITWNRNTEPNISHYEIYRADTEDFVPEVGNLFALRGDTILIDDEWRWFPHRYYKVAAVDSNGGRSGFAAVPLQDLTGTEWSGAPKVTYLSQNYPNPFNPMTRVDFGLSAPAHVSLRIYDASGRLVRMLVEGNRPAANYVQVWDGKDASGRAVSSGIYFYRLNARGFTETKKMVLLR